LAILLNYRPLSLNKDNQYVCFKYENFSFEEKGTYKGQNGEKGVSRSLKNEAIRGLQNVN